MNYPNKLGIELLYHSLTSNIRRAFQFHNTEIQTGSVSTQQPEPTIQETHASQIPNPPSALESVVTAELSQPTIIVPPPEQSRKPAPVAKSPRTVHKSLAVPSMKGYCVKCRAKRLIKDSTRIRLKNGRFAARGTCPVCATKVFRIVAG